MTSNHFSTYHRANPEYNKSRMFAKKAANIRDLSQFFLIFNLDP